VRAHRPAAAIATAVAAVLPLLAVPAGAAPEALPDRAPAISEPVRRGELVTTELPPRPPPPEGRRRGPVGLGR
jgi:hypothetical protein